MQFIAWSDGSKEWTTEAQEELNHTFGSDSTFWIPYEDLLRKYLHFDRTRLFRDPGWRSCQRWIGVEVPWKAQYNEKFHLKLTKESPVVLVLSQLDDRYFRGLQGQYTFRLQFRLHQEGRPSAEEYIVRSHGNYLMDRSVSVELPTLGPGNYAVYISISGERNTAKPSTEAVVQRECEGREENEKLAQVGQAYDLAHSKAASHLDRLSNLRKKTEGKKASEARTKKRRQNWERRQTKRAIKLKQEEKDKAKKAEGKRCKRAKAQAEAEALAKSKADAEAAAAKAAEVKIKEPQPQPADKAVQTGDDTSKEGESQACIDSETSSTTSTTSSSTSTAQHTPQVSPEVECSTTVKGGMARIEVPPAQDLVNALVSGGPPPAPAMALPPIQTGAVELKVHYCSCSTCKPPKAAEESDGYSSDSPIEDYEKLYDDDDPKSAIRDAESPTSPTKAPESDDEDAPEPWNAIAVVGFRVYSKDEGLELRVIMEGGELEQDGMGNLGEADLDNAVANAAGQRDSIEKQLKDGETAAQAKTSSEVKVVTSNIDTGDSSAAATPAVQEGEGTKLVATKAVYRTIIERKTSEFDRVMGKAKADKLEDSASAASSEASAKQSTSTLCPSPEVIAQPVCVQGQTNQGVQGASPLPVQTVSLNFEKPVDDTAKAVLLIRSKLQSGCRKLLVQGQSPKEKDLQEISDCLAALELYPDLEADVVLSTKIHKVMLAILKLDHLPKNDGFKFSIGSRAQALLDDYELSIMTSEDAKSMIVDGVQVA